MFSIQEKDRRVTAAERRLAEAERRVVVYAGKLNEAKDDLKRERAGLDWLRQAPVKKTDREEGGEV